jgi:hypothetical protein
MIILGRTSLGSPIWISWEIAENGAVIYTFAKFVDSRESFDAHVAFEVFYLRFLREKIEGWWQHAVREANSHYGKWRDANRTFVVETDRALGFRTSIDRASYGRKLLNVEFRDI